MVEMLYPPYGAGGMAFFIAPNGSQIPPNSYGASSGNNKFNSTHNPTVAIEYDTSRTLYDPSGDVVSEVTWNTTLNGGENKKNIGSEIGLGRLAVRGTVLAGGLGLILLLLWKKRAALRRFAYKELDRAMSHFLKDRKLEEEGFGGVYRGFIRDLKLNLDVKRVSRESKQGKEFKSWVDMGIESVSQDAKLVKNRMFIALEIACGRKAVETGEEEGKVSLQVAWVAELYANGKHFDLLVAREDVTAYEESFQMFKEQESAECKA
ncbi:hypothetical protein Scep_001403 [Stephania cephalantha]|uniref:Uncharacterized protein n=1 Tax=Stephania cephalantha TaxID=152367 RepID=A0AAP0L7U4_9MAGN